MKLIYLSKNFYSMFSNCPEILSKESRPYACIEIQIEDKTFAIPFRHHIKHSYCFHTTGEAGLDYTKAVIIESEDYIDSASPWVDTKEYRLLMKNERKITTEFIKYLKLYRNACNHKENPHYTNILSCSSLQYFDLP